MDCADVDALVSAIVGGSNSAVFDLDGNTVVDAADLELWLAAAGEENLGPGLSYLPADANLDGAVDGADFNVWNENKFTGDTGFCGGDFNADGHTDGSDFNVWNEYKFNNSDVRVRAVPEPSCSVTLLLLLAFFCLRQSRAS